MPTNNPRVFMPIACLGLAVVGWTAAAAHADQLQPEVYECWADPFGGTNCQQWVQRTEHNPLSGQDLFHVHMRCYTQMEIYVLYENMTVQDWVTDVGNSPRNNGHGGDDGSYSFDAELDLCDFGLGSEIGVYRNDYCLDCVRLVRYFDPIPWEPGLTVLRYLIRDGVIRIFPYGIDDPEEFNPQELPGVLPSDSRPLGEATGDAFFQLDGWDEEAQAWNDRQFFAGINRVIHLGTDPRVGTGAIFVVFRLSGLVDPCEDTREMAE